jgi:hypothetical protein
MSYPLSRKAVTQRDTVGIDTPKDSASIGVEYLPVRIRRKALLNRRSMSSACWYGILLASMSGSGNLSGADRLVGIVSCCKS